MRRCWCRDPVFRGEGKVLDKSPAGRRAGARAGAGNEEESLLDADDDVLVLVEMGLSAGMAAILCGSRKNAGEEEEGRGRGVVTIGGGRGDGVLRRVVETEGDRDNDDDDDDDDDSDGDGDCLCRAEEDEEERMPFVAIFPFMFENASASSLP